MSRRMKPYMTKPDPVRPPMYVYALVRKWQKRMNLGHWEVKLYTRTFKDKTAAEVRWTRSYKGAALHFSTKWLTDKTLTRDEVESTVVHELCHLLFAEMDDKLERYLGIGECFHEYGAAREGMCDTIARILIDRYKRARG